MFDYTLAGGIPAGSRTAWSRLPLQPLTTGVLTPFSYSLLAEITSRAWFVYFDRLGFEPMPRARILRQVNGAPYLNLTLSAQRDAEQAAIEPITLQINGQPFPICKWEKPSLLAGVKAALKERKVADLIQKLEGELPAVTQKAEAWFNKVKEFRWTQAEILLIMEEIEPAATPAMTTLFATCHNLDLVMNRLLRATHTQAAFPKNLRLIEAALGRIDAAVVHPMSAELATLTDDVSALGKAASEPTTRTQDAEKLLAISDAKQRKQIAAWLQQAQRLRLLQYRAQQALSYILTGTRRWALAAVREAMADKRILETQDVFFFELEEMKQMMTGEWNISDQREIQATAVKRKAEYQQWQAVSPLAELLIGDVPAQPTSPWQE